MTAFKNASPIFTATIDSLSHDGRGITRVDGKTVFISNSLPGETVAYQRIAKHRRFDEGVTVEILTPSPQRVEAQCEHFGVCGGCSLQHLSPQAQIDFKQQILLEHFQHIGKVTPEHLMPPLQASAWAYRRKGRLGVKYVAKKETLLVGFRELRSNFLAELNRCEVLHQAVGTRITALRDLIRHLDTFQSIAQIEVAAGDEHTALVIRHLQPLPSSDIQQLEQFAEQHHLYIYLQPAGLDSIAPLYPKDLPLHGLKYSLPQEQIDFEFAPFDFIQVNAEMNRLMVAQAMDWLAVTAQERVLDLFCGLGNFTLPLARRAAQVTGVEGEASLVMRAQANAMRQGFQHIEYHVANLADEKLQQAWMQQLYDKVLLDPPRTGALEIIRALPFKQTQRIVYVSCNPATLARDAAELVSKGFRLVQAGVMDMFPHTAHVEAMAVFER